MITRLLGPWYDVAWFAVALLAVVLLVTALRAWRHSDTGSATATTLWLVLIIVVPIVGPAIFLASHRSQEGLDAQV